MGNKQIIEDLRNRSCDENILRLVEIILDSRKSIREMSHRANRADDGEDILLDLETAAMNIMNLALGDGRPTAEEMNWLMNGI